MTLTPKPALLPVSDALIKHMVDRFLSWRLPEDFNPDGGIHFTSHFNVGVPKAKMAHRPAGTNLFHHAQAEAMVRHMIGGYVATPAPTCDPGEVEERARELLIEARGPSATAGHIRDKEDNRVVTIDAAIRAIIAALSPAASAENGLRGMHSINIGDEEHELRVYGDEIAIRRAQCLWEEFEDIVDYRNQLDQVLEELRALKAGNQRDTTSQTAEARVAELSDALQECADAMWADDPSAGWADTIAKARTALRKDAS